MAVPSLQYSLQAQSAEPLCTASVMTNLMYEYCILWVCYSLLPVFLWNTVWVSWFEVFPPYLLLASRVFQIAFVAETLHDIFGYLLSKQGNS